MNILLINPSKKVRTEVNSLSYELGKSHHTVKVLLTEECRSTLHRHDGVSYEFFQATYVPGVRYSLPMFSFYEKLRRNISEHDIIHPCSYFYIPCTISAVAGSHTNIGVVVTVDSLPGVNWSYGNTTIDAIGRTYTATLGRLTFLSADRVVALGEYLVDDLQRYAPWEKIRVIPNGIDTTEYRIERRKSKAAGGENPVELLYVGRLDPVKGVPHLISALAKLVREEPAEYNLTIVGDGTERAEYERQCEAAGIDSHVRFEGWQGDVTPYYAAADVFVLPSLSEGQPTVLLEAQASGIPVVTTDVGGAGSLVTAGQVVPTRDSDALAAAIAEVGAEYAGGVAEEARESIVELFSTETMCAAYLRLYEEVLAEQ